MEAEFIRSKIVAAVFDRRKHPSAVGWIKRSALDANPIAEGALFLASPPKAFGPIDLPKVRGARRLLFGWIFKQFDHSLEQPAGAAAVQASMVETQRDLGLGFRDEEAIRFIP